MHSLSSYKKTHHSDALLHQYFDELPSKNPYSNRMLYTDFPGVVVCLAPLSLQGLFSLSRPARLVQNRQGFDDEVVGSQAELRKKQSITASRATTYRVVGSFCGNFLPHACPTAINLTDTARQPALVRIA